MTEFSWVPGLNGKYLDYHGYFACVISAAAIAIGFICLFLDFFLRTLANLIPARSKTSQQNMKERELQPLNQQSADLSFNESLHQDQSDDSDFLIGIKSFLLHSADFLYNCSFFWFSICPLICGALSVITTSLSIVFMVALYSLKTYIDCVLYRTYSIQEQLYNIPSSESTVKDQVRKRFVKLVSFTTFWCILMPLIAYKTCICFYNSEIGYYNYFFGFNINSLLVRQFELNSACPEGKPCHFYATVPEDTAHAVFINVHTAKNVNNVTVFYDSLEYYINNGNQTRFNVQATTYDIQGIERHGERNVHSALIDGLQPNTKYMIKIFYHNQFWDQKIYKTVPNTMDNITIVNGGDQGFTKQAVGIMNLLNNPDIFFIGGDLAYDDAFVTCYYTWDFFLGMYEATFDRIGYIFPIVLGVGNHDVGLNELPGINITVSLEGPAFFTFFPQHYARDENNQIVKQIPKIEHRSTIFYHYFADIVYLCLDSGYIFDFGGYQEEWIVSTLAKFPKTLKFVNYHVPIYSACDNPEDNKDPIIRAMLHWVPHFDRFRVMGAYENHVHAFKRTKPLVGNYPAVNGTVYYGDGNLGAIENHCDIKKDLNLFAVASPLNNVWISYVTKDQVINVAFDWNGNQLDKYVQNNAYYLQLPIV